MNKLQVHNSSGWQKHFAMFLWTKTSALVSKNCFSKVLHKKSALTDFSKFPCTEAVTRDLLQKQVFLKISKIHRKTPVPESAGLAPFLQNTSGRLLLHVLYFDRAIYGKIVTRSFPGKTSDDSLMYYHPRYVIKAI